MPIVNRDVERQIVEKGLAEGKDQEFIKQAVLRYRGKAGSQQPFQSSPEQIQSAQQTAGPMNSVQSMPEEKGFFQQLGEELIAPFKQIKRVEEEASKTKNGRTKLMLSKFLGPVFGPIAAAPKGERLKTAGAVGEIAAYAVPGVGELKGLSVAAKAAKLAKTRAVTGGVLTGSGAIRRGETDVKQIAKESGAGAILNMIIPVVGSKLAKTAKNTMIGTAENIYKRLIKTPVAQTRAGKEEIASGLLKRGVSGNYQNMLDTVSKTVGQSKQAVDDIIKNTKAEVDIEPVLAELKVLKKQLADTPGETTTAVDRVIKQLNKKTKLSLQEAQSLKQNLQRAVNDAFLKKTTSGVTQAQKTAAQKLRQEIEKVVPDIAPHNKEIEFGLRAMNRLKETANLSPSKLRVFTELLTAGIGLAYNPVITGAVAAERILTTPKIASKAGKVLYKVGKSSMNKKVTDLLNKLMLKAIGPK